MVNNLSSEAKLFADDTSLFFVVYDELVAAEKLNKDLETISKWAHQWKMQFNPDKNKQAVEVIFSHKSPKPPHLHLYFNQAEVPVAKEHKHLEMIFHSKLDFSAHVKEAIVKASKGIGMIRYMVKYVSRDVYDQIYKLYVRPHLDYSDIIYHSHDPELTHDMTKRLERIQYSAALAVSEAWRGTNIDRLYEEQGWESLYYRRWYRRLCHFFKVIMNQSPTNLYQLVPPLRSVRCNLRGANVYESNVERTNRFASTYFQNCIKEWNQLDVSIRSSQTISELK